MPNPLPAVARLTPQLLSVEAWGGATYDVALRFLGEDPWDRLAAVRQALPNVAIQMLLRGRNTVGYTPYPERVTEAFIQEAAATGVDVFRIGAATGKGDLAGMVLKMVRAHGEHQARLHAFAQADQHSGGTPRRIAQQFGHVRVVPAPPDWRRRQRSQRVGHDLDHGGVAGPRSGSTSRISRHRSASSRALHRPISSLVRRQPTQYPCGSRRQTWMQGVSGAGTEA